MQLDDLIVLLLLGLIVFQFWQIRALTEMANRFAANYCKQHNLQLVSVARSNTRLGFYRKHLVWKLEFMFEFSANRESLNRGFFLMQGKTVTNIDVPAYPIN
ncbi:DUF3301 domain-containing protein [Alteromonas sp. ASW11-36]|uniref:DUF3301 domain-containing protein n=1 Tax=Alteromonas arenosi TaxID=3055817 RepID=A0ABT7SXE7_9ALTE|nr:DUF3301 domain-containing protein [Alteromonas sp. ASW11-36]MDM7860222.1 DUF3301 domain-containing protein [Alteromonas sp. ASW11-36]